MRWLGLVFLLVFSCEVPPQPPTIDDVFLYTKKYQIVGSKTQLGRNFYPVSGTKIMRFVVINKKGDLQLRISYNNYQDPILSTTGFCTGEQIFSVNKIIEEDTFNLVVSEESTENGGGYNVLDPENPPDQEPSGYLAIYSVEVENVDSTTFGGACPTTASRSLIFAFKDENTVHIRDGRDLQANIINE